MHIWAFLLAALWGISGTLGHVALTFPPARQYDLDFLDNARTPAPCGMPRSSTKTSLVQGSTVNITWHLAYPHQGGFQIQLLGRNERVMQYLAPTDNTFISDDPTAQGYSVKLPDDVQCRGCTIRLLRQASEWGSRYRFWSCADVDIVTARQIRRPCSGNGRKQGGKCQCKSTYEGDECQFKNECDHDGHCGTQGRCLHIRGTAYPKKRCFCRGGYYGKNCAKISDIRKENDIKFGFYESRKLSDKMTLYWRILKNKKEIEFVMVNQGISYAALGWRPPGTSTSCRRFPKIEGPAPPYDTKVVPEGEPGSEPESEPEGEPVAEGEPEPEGEPGKVKLPYPEPEGEPEKVELPYPEPEGKPEKVELPYPEPENEPGSVKLPYPEPENENNPGKVLFPGNSNDENSALDGKKPLSLADRLAGFGRRRKRETFNPVPAPLLKKAKKKVVANPLKPSASPLSEPEPENEPETYAEGAKAEAEPEAEGEPEGEAESEPEGEPESEPEGEPESEPEGEPESEPEEDSEPSSPYQPRGATLHPMDCTDIVIGIAKGNHYLIKDYYTRDRSTPRLDEFWGGEDSLTTAFGFEKDGKTTILFRKKLNANHPTDHNITDSLMHLIWARGQEADMYVHVPNSGLEAGTPSVPNFYSPDEIKYHGRKDQRGVLSLNLFDQNTNLAQAGGKNKVDWCGGEWRYPSSCSPAAKDCEYAVRWEYIEASDDIKFSVVSKHIGLWSGIGFSEDTRMSKTDVIIGWALGAGADFVFDGYLTRYSSPSVDDDQNVKDFSGSLEDDHFTLNFTRKRISDDPKDFSFTDDKCLYMMFPIKGGKVSYVSKKMNKHELTPIVSSRRICIRSCVKYGAPGGDQIIFTTTQAPPEVKYNVEFMIINTGNEFKVPEPGSPAYNTLVNQMTSSTQDIFEELPGFVVADIIGLEDAGDKKVKTVMQVTFNQKEHDAGGNNQKKGDEIVYDAMKEPISSGRLGNFAVEPNFLRVNSLGVTDGSSTLSDADREVEHLNPLAFVSKYKYWFIGAGVLAFIVLALLQAIITMCRAQKKTSPPISTKERLITNSRWKDYSRSNQGFEYETYEREKPPESHRSNTLMRAPPPREHPQAPSHRNGRVGGGGASHSQSHSNGGHYPPIESQPDTRSLQRPRHNPPTLSDPRTTYSLPRGNTPSLPPSYNSAMQELTPDFYYLPSQRKYSGEVVRVYVDYNKAK